MALNSARSAAETLASACANSAARSLGTATRASHSRGIVLITDPPLKAHKRSWSPSCACSAAVHSSCAMSLMALPRPRWMSTPVWPPCRPLTLRSRQERAPSAASAALVTGRRMWVSNPPAQPTQTAYSSSLSRLMSRLALRKGALPRRSAPPMVVSSSTVKRHSSGPCFASGSRSSASIAAQPMPSSAPSVVPVAFNHSPSIRQLIGSLSKSKTVSLFAEHTMSK
mmetsp:Transcript_49587/g.124685  ORF Transcript_49587/g.124685 Transcript_49587/m.124685 type:complete len:226 (+) Transcript_49587:642-1319(+)